MTQRLVAMMIRDKNFADFIQNGWNCLYNDILTTHYTKWYKLDAISGMAIWVWMEKMEFEIE